MSTGPRNRLSIPRAINKLELSEELVAFQTCQNWRRSPGLIAFEIECIYDRLR